MTEKDERGLDALAEQGERRMLESLESERVDEDAKAVAALGALATRLEGLGQTGLASLVSTVKQHRADVAMARQLLGVALGRYASGVALQALALEIWARAEANHRGPIDGIYVGVSGEVYVLPVREPEAAKRDEKDR